MATVNGPDPAVATNAVGKVADAGLDRERSAQRIGDPRGGTLLLERELGMGMHGVRKLDERSARCRDTSFCATAFTSTAFTFMART